MTNVSAPATFPRSTDAELYPSFASKLHCMLEQGAIITYTKDRSITDEIALESDSPSLSKKTMMGVPKGTRSSDSRRKVLVRRVREIDVAVNWSISMLVVRERY